ncbi:universal stress protein [Emticicia sp. 17c]|uniref:universal stress protein n=1 Tax=Emticicia sp. 17c TaxID=3127704 RepID=UPI00301B75C6
MKKIVIATDFSENSDSALVYATFLAQQWKAELLVIHAYFPVVSIDPNLAYDTVAPSTLQEEMIKSFEEQLDKIVDSLKDKQVKAQRELVVGSLSSGIAAFAKEKNADLIVVGKTPDTSFFNRLIGNTALHVVDNVNIPVLVVPVNSPAPSFRKIIYGTELESEEKEVLAKVFEWADTFKAKVELIKVNVDFELDVQDDKQLLKDIEKNFAKEKFTFSTIKAEQVSEGLLNAAHTHKADLLVVARHHHSFLSELINPGKSKTIINKTDIPLLVYDMGE